MKCLFFVLGVLLSPIGFAASVYTQTQPASWSSYALGGANWQSFTSIMESQNSITAGSDFSDLDQLLLFDAVWVDHQGIGSSLISEEVSALSQYISLGNRVVLIGEMDQWSDWNRSLMDIVGGRVGNECTSGVGATISNYSIVDNVSNVQKICGSNISPSPYGDVEILFDNYFAGIYRVGAGEALVIMDSNWNDDTYLTNSDNAQFAENVATWIGQPTVVPVPTAVWLFGSALTGLGWVRRKQAV